MEYNPKNLILYEKTEWIIMERRVPIYLLLDTSGSMEGKPIQAVRNGVQTIVDALMSSPEAKDVGYLSIITFGTDAEEKMPLTRIADFDFDTGNITASGLTAMGGALNLLLDRIEGDVRHKKDEQERGDWRPIVYLITDGEPTDDIGAGNAFDRALTRLNDVQFAAFLILAAGKDANKEKLDLILSYVYTRDNNYKKCYTSELTASDIENNFVLVSELIAANLAK